MHNFTFAFLEEQIKLKERILILTHTNPDGDAIGSLMAIRNIILEKGKTPSIFFSGKTSCNLKLEEESLITKETHYNQYDLIIIVDTSNPKRTGIPIPSNLEELPETFIIDHHLKKGGKIEYPKNIYYYINPKATATCEIIYDLLKKEEKFFSKETAYYLLLGIYTDSGGFFHSNTTPQLLKKTRDLLKMGVLFKNVTLNAFKGKNVRVLNYLGEKISDSKFNPELKFIFNTVKGLELAKKNISASDISGLVNLLNMCSDSIFSLLLFEENNLIKGSFRSHEYKKIDVSHLSRFLGGGGHKLASGFEVPGKVVETYKKISIKN